MTDKQFVINSKGDKVAVIIPIAEYEKLLELTEELEDIKTYDEVKETETKYTPA